MITNMRKLGLITGIVMMAVQLSGCYVDVDHHYHPYWHHRDEAVVVVHP
jgi:hypothetical protein